MSDRNPSDDVRRAAAATARDVVKAKDALFRVAFGTPPPPRERQTGLTKLGPMGPAPMNMMLRRKLPPKPIRIGPVGRKNGRKSGYNAPKGR